MESNSAAAAPKRSHHAAEVSDPMPICAPLELDSLYPLLSPAAVRSCACVWVCVGVPLLCKHSCKRCGASFIATSNDRHQQCSTCNHDRRYPSSSSASTPASSSSPPALSIFNRPDGCIDQLSLVERAAIITLHGVGWTGRDIAQELHCSESAVSLWLTRWQESHSLQDSERSGRPRCTDEETDVAIEEYADKKVNVTPKDIVREMELPVSAHTVRRRLDEVGLYGRVQQEEHVYTDENIRRRISFAEGYSRWTEDDWSRVMFSDETHFYLGHHGREYVQRPVGMALDPKYTLKTDRLEGKVSLWGCICAGGLGHAELYVDSLDARRYQSILALNLVSSARQFWPKGQWWYQQDNWTVHTAHTSQVWFHNHGIDLIDWPAWSPDLNPIENLWSDLKRRVYAHHPKTMEELEQWIGSEWQATDLNFISHTCRSMPKRLQLVLENNGHKISY